MVSMLYGCQGQGMLVNLGFRSSMCAIVLEVKGLALQTTDTRIVKVDWVRIECFIVF